MAENLEHLREWIGRSEISVGQAAAWPADALAATFDRDDPPLQPGDPIPPGWHWLYFPEVVKLSETGTDGHPARGGFMPPVPLPNRMWAANRMSFHQPLRVGETVERAATITDVTPKGGRSGSLVFVTVRHEISGGNGIATVEDHTTVYRTPPAPGGARPQNPPPAEAVWNRAIHPTPVLLFRFSALTMNSHRIHYDQPYVTQTEGYPGLVVHGPLTALLLLDLFRREMPQKRLVQSSIRAQGPLFDTADFTVEGVADEGGSEAKLWALDHTGSVAMSAEVKYAG
jgi:3-methylfumaryl-CoA hydratase